MAVNNSIKLLKLIMKMSNYNNSRFSPSIISYFKPQSVSPNDEIVLQSHYVLSNPAKFSKIEYLDAWPDNLNYPIWSNARPVEENLCCDYKVIDLPSISQVFKPLKIKFMLNNCAAYEDYAIHLEDFLLSESIDDFNHRTYFVYLQEFIRKLETRAFINGLNLEVDVDDDLFDLYRSIYTSKEVIQVYNESTNYATSFQCFCFEPTSNFGAACHAYKCVMHLLGIDVDQTDANAQAERWLLEFGDLILNFSIFKLLMTFIKILREFIPLETLINQIIKLIKYCINYTTNSASSFYEKVLNFSQQPTIENEDSSFEKTSNVFENLNLIDLTQFPIDNQHISASLSAVVVLISSVVIGYDTCKNSTQQSTALKVSSSMQAIAKTKSGISAMVSMFQDLSKWIQMSMISIMAGSVDDQVSKLILRTSVIETDDCQKSKFFEYLKFIKDPRNLFSFQRNDIYLQQLEFVYKNLDEILYTLAQTDSKDVGMSLRSYLQTTYNEVKAVRTLALKRPVLTSWRFKPFWINIIGKSMTGKSVAQSYIANALYEILKECPNYNVPSKDRWLYSINFSDQFMTDYCQEYCVLIDDFLQDAAPVGNRSSCLDMINFVSAIPYKTNQAGIAEKGIPFDSKIIISSSNDANMSRKEIIDTEALKNRQGMCVCFETLETSQPDPLLGGKRVTISLRNSKHFNTVVKVYKNLEEFLADIVVEFQKHWDLQQQIKISRELTKEVKDRVMTNIIKKQRSQNLSVDIFNERLEDPIEVEQSSYIPSWCTFRTPELILEKYPVQNDFPIEVPIKVYNCKCEKHSLLNEEYRQYVSVAWRGESFLGIKELNSIKLDKEDKFENKFLSTYNKIIENIKKYWSNNKFKVLCSFVGAVAMYLGTSKLLFKQDKEPLVSTAAQYSLKPKRLKTQHAFIKTSDDMYSLSDGKQARDLVNNVLLRRGLVCKVQNTQTLEEATALRIKNRCILANHHFFNALRNGDKFVVRILSANGVQQATQVFSSQHLRRVGSKDLAVYNCDKSLEQSKDILSHFPDSHVKIENHNCIVATAYPNLQVYNNVYATPTVHTTSTYEGDKFTTYSLLDCFKTTCPVDKGMSGSIMVSSENKMKNKILGIQVCRNKATMCGYFVAISREELEKAIDSIDSVDYDLEKSSLIPEEADSNCPPNLGNNLQYLGTLPKNKILKQQTKTKIIPSLIQEPPLTQLPSVLEDSDIRMNDEIINSSVIFRAVEGFSQPIGAVDRDILQQSLDDMKVEYDVVLDDRNIPRRLLDDNEMINGVPGLINRVEMKTSPGYPFVLERTRTDMGGKFEWFTELDTPYEGYGKTYVMKDSLKSGLEQREKSMLAGIKPPTIAYTCLKDETRPLEKIKSGSTRAFICLPLDYNLLIRKYFGAFIASMHLHAVGIASCVGIDPSTQWKDLYDRLANKNMKWEDFDYKNWDQHLHPEFVFAVASLVNYWYGDTDNSPNGRVRLMLIHDLVYTTIIVKNRLMKKQSGQCSGCAITAELNSLVHDLLMYYVWNVLNTKSNRRTDLHEFRHYVAYAIYGDDIIKAVRPDCPIEFSGNTIKPIMEELGMKITPGDKKSTEFIVKDPENVLFLKRSFRVDGHLVKAPLRSDIVENITQWIHKSDSLNAEEATFINAETAVREGYMHGGNYFHKLLSSVNERIKKYNLESHSSKLEPVILNYRMLDAMYMDNEFTCVGLGSQPEADL